VALIFNIFLAGTDTTQLTLRWMLLFMIKYPEMQRKLRAEIYNEIGDRVALLEDKSKLNYVMAYITEVLRSSNITPNWSSTSYLM